MATLAEMIGGSGTPGTFLGLDRAESVGAAADIVIYGADCATPYPWVGAYCAGGPTAIRAGSADYAGAVERVNFDLMGPLLPKGVRAVDAGDLATEPGDPSGNRDRIEAATRQILGNGAVPVLLGGDDSVPLGMLRAFDGGAPLTILQIDAHIDWRDEVRGERLGLSSTMRRASEMAHVERIVQVGARGVGSAGMEALEAAQAWGAHLIPAHELDTGGIARAIGLVPEGARVVVCFDVDALDPAIMPAVIAPTAGGLSYREAMALIRGVAEKATLAGFDLVEFMPERDRDGIGARTAAQLLTSVIGLIGRQRAGA
ncbi:arginase family protein [Seohaeicola zhoushanensis]|uniref:Agmatinase n=1 Tax=Seohaeicola zhoushanensis TaxID=1569283 RepID=A0A8J3GYB1_9RHOB|nr:arginase family protein [Seohaeicola zhoushanensis]GHF50457.1 agmatinase [Seohaeicola zhoushanensis]